MLQLCREACRTLSRRLAGMSSTHTVLQILESEGAKQSVINRAEGEKAEVILQSEAARTDAVNRATGA